MKTDQFVANLGNDEYSYITSSEELQGYILVAKINVFHNNTSPLLRLVNNKLITAATPENPFVYIYKQPTEVFDNGYGSDVKS